MLCRCVQDQEGAAQRNAILTAIAPIDRKVTMFVPTDQAINECGIATLGSDALLSVCFKSARLLATLRVVARRLGHGRRGARTHFDV